ncbi:MAG: hydrogenase [candidate division Zixibacteria bacterium]|nr:hydrogenase [candidate division Zixibacteria bacterium]
MKDYADLLLLLVAVSNLYIVATSRLNSCVRASAIQGAALALLPLVLWTSGFNVQLFHLAVICAGTLAIKAIVIPILVSRAIREANVRREVDPSVSLHSSVLLAGLLMGISFWMSTVLVLPRPAPTMLLVPVAFATLLTGFLVLISRRQAITHVIGYLLIENGVFIFGQTLAREVPFAVELGILLDLLVGIFVMGIAINHISREFDHIDTELLSTLKD